MDYLIKTHDQKIYTINKIHLIEMIHTLSGYRPPIDELKDNIVKELQSLIYDRQEGVEKKVAVIEKKLETPDSLKKPKTPKK